MKMNITAIKPDPNQPRKIFDEKHIRGLSKSLAQEGIINPIEIDETGMIITGECRYRAATLLGWTKVPVNVNRGKMNVYERLRRQMAENVHQSGADKDSMMNPIDTAKGYANLLKMRGKYRPGRKSQGKDEGISELAREIGISPDTISQYLEILNEPVFIQKAINAGLPRTYIREANRAPEEQRKDIKKKIAKGEYPSRESLQREIQLSQKLPELARINLERKETRESTATNKILNGVASLALALQDQPLQNVDIREKGIVKRQLEWIQDKIKEYLV